MTPFARLWLNLRAYFMIDAAAIRWDLGGQDNPVVEHCCAAVGLTNAR